MVGFRPKYNYPAFISIHRFGFFPGLAHSLNENESDQAYSLVSSRLPGVFPKYAPPGTDILLVLRILQDITRLNKQLAEYYEL